MLDRNYILGIKLMKAPAEGSYLRDMPPVKHLQRAGQLMFTKPVTFLAGENGSGKSTLLEAIAVASGFNGEGGSRDFSFSTRRTHSELCELIMTIKTVSPRDGFFLRAESFYNAASYLDDSGSLLTRYGGVSLHKQSHGEAFMSLITNRFEGEGLYLLDEPESALSPQRLLSLLCVMDRLVKQNSQFIIATHSPILMAYPNACILLLSDEGIKEVAYRETEHYQVTKQFMDNPERMIKYLLED
ncbi:MAG: AAA family ATPase [Oscillospiraceae bacterium]|nr:AAA family ATPase [Oscillospiraceae bacterium]